MRDHGRSQAGWHTITGHECRCPRASPATTAAGARSALPAAGRAATGYVQCGLPRRSAPSGLWRGLYRRGVPRIRGRLSASNAKVAAEQHRREPELCSGAFAPARSAALLTSVEWVCNGMAACSWSALAGEIDPACPAASSRTASLERALIREVREELGLDRTHLRRALTVQAPVHAPTDGTAPGSLARTYQTPADCSDRTTIRARNGRACRHKACRPIR